MTRVKVCGIRTLEEALAAVEAGVDAIGFVFAPSPRRIAPEEARRIALLLPPFVSKVGVFVNSPRSEVSAIASFCRLDALQFHGEEEPADCLGWELPVIKAVRVRDAGSIARLPEYRVSAFLLDAWDPARHGGTGKSFPWELALEAKRYGPVILAGGITPENAAAAVRCVRPYAVDVSSGVETEGRKDPEKIKALVAAVRRGECDVA